MAYAANRVGLGSYLNPQDLLPDEIAYELNLRGLNLSGYCLDDQKQALRKAQLDEIQNSKVVYSTKTIMDDLTIIQIKLTTVRQELEMHGTTRQLMSRLRHLRLRVLRSNAMDSHQVKVKDELMEEIELIYEVFATPEDQISGQHRSTSGRKSLPNLGTVPRDPALEFPPPPHVPRSSEIGTVANLIQIEGISEQGPSADHIAAEGQRQHPLLGGQPVIHHDRMTPQQQQQQQQHSGPQQEQQQQVLLEHAQHREYSGNHQQQPNEQRRQQGDHQVDLAGHHYDLQRQQQRQMELQQQFQNQVQRPRRNNLEDIFLRGTQQDQPAVGPRATDREQLELNGAANIELPPIQELDEQTLSRADVNRIVEDVMANKMDQMMDKLMQSMQNLLANQERRNIDRQEGSEENLTFIHALDGINFSAISNPQVQQQRGQSFSVPVGPTLQQSRDRTPNGIAGNIQSSIGSQNRNRANLVPGMERENCFRTPINKWQIRFSGDQRGMSVEEFVKRVETLAKNNQISDAELLSKANFLFKPESPAEIWYYTFSSKFTSWAVLKYHLRLRFEVPNKDKVLERQIRDRKQLPNETFVAYLGEVERLCQQMSKPIDEKTKLDIIFENMKDWYRPHLAFLNTTQLTVETLCSLCYELDKSVYRSYAQRNRTYNVNNLEGDAVEDNGFEEEIEEEVNAINKVRPLQNKRQEEQKKENQPTVPMTENNILCWNCNQYGHFWRNCNRGKRIFCHVCGRPDVVLSNCPSDHNNVRSNVSKNEYRGSN